MSCWGFNWDLMVEPVRVDRADKKKVGGDREGTKMSKQTQGRSEGATEQVRESSER